MKTLDAVGEASSSIPSARRSCGEGEGIGWERLAPAAVFFAGRMRDCFDSDFATLFQLQFSYVSTNW
jgi:hypothetical protein